MAILFNDNFDGEGEGTDPPINWTPDTVAPLDNNEVDDAQSHSAPHSMWLKSKVGANGFIRHVYSSGFTDEKITIWVYFPNTTNQRQIFTQDITGDKDSNAQAALLAFQNDGDIEYYDGAYQDTGYNYTSGFHKIEIIQDFINDVFDCWYDDIKIITDGGFRNVATDAKALHLFCASGGTEIWIDDVQIGENAECKVSPAQAGPMAGGVTI